MTIYRSEFRTIGFRRSEIIPFLQRLGVNITDTPKEDVGEQITPSRLTPPTWCDLVMHWSTLSVEDCTHVMLGLNPAVEQPLSFYDGNERFYSWRKAIDSACESGKLPARKHGENYRITPEALIGWCNRYGYTCPLAMSDGNKTENDEAISHSAAEHTRIQTEMRRLQASLSEASERADRSELEASRLRARLKQLEAQLPPYLDPQHPRYAARLAAAIRFWEAMVKAQTKATVKEAGKWIDSHRAEYGLDPSDKLGICVGYLAMTVRDGKDA